MRYFYYFRQRTFRSNEGKICFFFFYIYTDNFWHYLVILTPRPKKKNSRLDLKFLLLFMMCRAFGNSTLGGVARFFSVPPLVLLSVEAARHLLCTCKFRFQNDLVCLGKTISGRKKNLWIIKKRKKKKLFQEVGDRSARRHRWRNHFCFLRPPQMKNTAGFFLLPVNNSVRWQVGVNRWVVILSALYSVFG